VALVATACGLLPGADPEQEVDTVVMRLNPSQVAVAVAQDQGCYEDLNLNVDYTQVGYGESAALFLAGDDPVLVVTNLVDFDTKYGHRNDPEGYARCVEAFDRRVPEIMDAVLRILHGVAALDRGLRNWIG
jgi:hypothetical protein